MEGCKGSLQVEAPGARQSVRISMGSASDEQLMKGCCEARWRVEEGGIPQASASSAKGSL